MTESSLPWLLGFTSINTHCRAGDHIWFSLQTKTIHARIITRTGSTFTIRFDDNSQLMIPPSNHTDERTLASHHSGIGNGTSVKHVRIKHQHGKQVEWTYTEPKRPRTTTVQAASIEEDKPDPLVTTYKRISTQLALPEELCRYKRGALVGSGTFANVYVAWDTLTSAWVVLKVLKRTHEGTSWTGLDAARREILAQRVCRGSPYILALLDVFMLPGKTTLVFPLMEHDLPGLRHATKSILYKKTAGPENPLFIAAVKSIIKDVANALRDLHARGLVHRDIKPNNILIGANGGAVLADFGWSRFIPSDNQEWTWPPCFPAYRPFEVHMGVREASGPSVDLYGLGCLLFDLLAGYPLMAGSTEQEALASIVRVLGTPSSSLMARIRQESSISSSLPRLNPYPFRLPEICRTAGLDSVVQTLLQSLVQYDWRKRPSAENILTHPWFTLEPLPSLGPSQLPETNTYEKIISNK